MTQQLRAEVWKYPHDAADPWTATVFPADIRADRTLPIQERDDWDATHRTYHPTHAAALAAALKAVGLGKTDPDPSRCPMRATDPITTRHPRDDGWRCGHEAGHKHGHALYTSDGEDTLYAGRWVHPAEIGLTTPPEHMEAP